MDGIYRLLAGGTEFLRQMLKLQLDGGDFSRIQQVAQLRVANQLAKLCVIDRQRLRAPFRQRGASPS